MTKKSEVRESPENESRLLSSEERAICGQIATEEPPHSSRAKALLALDEGATLAGAGRQAGLTFGQVRYWLGKFRIDRISIFPEELLNLAQGEDADPSQDSPDRQVAVQTASAEEAGPAGESDAQQEDGLEVDRKPKKKSKKVRKPKKAKKTKKTKKTKKVKKTKKSKKGKKSTKKTGKKSSNKSKGAKGKSSKPSKKKSKK